MTSETTRLRKVRQLVWDTESRLTEVFKEAQQLEDDSAETAEALGYLSECGERLQKAARLIGERASAIARKGFTE